MGNEIDTTERFSFVYDGYGKHITFSFDLNPGTVEDICDHMADFLKAAGFQVSGLSADSDY